MKRTYFEKIKQHDYPPKNNRFSINRILQVQLHYGTPLKPKGETTREPQANKPKSLGTLLLRPKRKEIPFQLSGLSFSQTPKMFMLFSLFFQTRKQSEIPSTTLLTLCFKQALGTLLFLPSQNKTNLFPFSCLCFLFRDHPFLCEQPSVYIKKREGPFTP